MGYETPLGCRMHIFSPDKHGSNITSTLFLVLDNSRFSWKAWLQPSSWHIESILTTSSHKKPWLETKNTMVNLVGPEEEDIKSVLLSLGNLFPELSLDELLKLLKSSNSMNQQLTLPVPYFELCGHLVHNSYISTSFQSFMTLLDESQSQTNTMKKERKAHKRNKVLLCVVSICWRFNIEGGRMSQRYLLKIYKVKWRDEKMRNGKAYL